MHQLMHLETRRSLLWRSMEDRWRQNDPILHTKNQTISDFCVSYGVYGAKTWAALRYEETKI